MKYKLRLEKNYYPDTYGFYNSSNHSVGNTTYRHFSPNILWEFNLIEARYVRFLMLKKYKVHLQNLHVREIKIYEISS